jgi:hypothetical protein
MVNFPPGPNFIKLLRPKFTNFLNKLSVCLCQAFTA